MAEDASGNNTANSGTPNVPAGTSNNPSNASTSPATAETPNSAKPDDKLKGPPIGVLNRRESKRIKRDLDPDFTSIWAQIAAVTAEVFKEDTDQSSGPYRAICLTGPETMFPATGKGFATEQEYFADNNPHLKFLFGLEGEIGLSAKKLIQIRARIPELHMHLPVPKDDKDWAAISMYPVFTAETENSNNGVVPNPGEIVIVDFGDKVNKTDGIFISGIKETQSRTAQSGQANCPPPASPASMGSPPQGGAAPVDVGSQGPISSRLKASQPGQKAVIFGDSQCQGGMGRKISKYLKDEMGYELIVPGAEFGNAKFKAGGGRTWARHSSKAKEWCTPGPSQSDQSSYSNFRKGLWHMLEPMFQQKPALVAIIGGGNGAGPGDATALINKIRSVAGNCAIAWFSAPLGVPTRATRPIAPSKFNGGPNNWTPKESWKQSREKVIDLIGSEVKALPNTIFVKTPDLTPRYNASGCGGCDGIHMPSKNADELIANIKAAGSPTPGGENMDFLNSMKNALAGIATGFKKALKDIASLQKNLETQMGQMSMDMAKANIKQASERLGLSEDQIKNRNWYSGYKSMSVSSAWKPPTYFELAKMYGFQSPNKIALEENIAEMDARLADLLTSSDPDEVKFAEEYYAPEVQKAKQLWEQMGDVNQSLPGEPFPSDADKIKSLQIEMALKIKVSSDKIKKAEQPAPASPSASPGPTPNCGNTTGASMAGVGGPLPAVNIGAVQFKEGPLTPEEMVAFFMGFGKKFGYTKEEMVLLAACCKNEAGPINKNKNRTGRGGCSIRLEPHVSARRIGSSCAWYCCKSGQSCADGTRGWTCKGDGKFPGCGWSGLAKCVAAHPGEVCYQSLTPGIAQAFFVSKWRSFEGQPLGNSPSEYVEIMKRSHAAQIFALFAFVETKGVLRKAIKTLNIPATARFYNGAKSNGGKLSGYGARLELYCRGLSYRDSMPYYNWGARKPKDVDWYTTAPPTNSAAETAARNMTTEYSLSPDLFKPNPTIASDIILAQYDSFQPQT